MSKSKKQQPVVVNRKFLNDLANTIYNSKNRTFLRLCDGKLQNGPDPTDESRPMHCGLGELYFQMTGRQPEDDGVVCESDVVALAVKNSTFDDSKTKAIQEISRLAIAEPLKQELLDAVDNYEDPLVEEFEELLLEIPSENDDGEGNACSVKTFRERSRRVAAKLKEAGKLLPE